MTIRNPFEPDTVVSRRGGKVKQPLGRDVIVAKALELLLRDGLDGMSLRKVAAALETGPATLYAYVEDLRELEALVLDHALAQVRTAGGRQKPWRERLDALLISYLRVLVRHAGLAQLALRTIAAGPNALRILECLLGILEDGGVDDATAAWAVDLLMLYVTGIAAEQSHGGHDDAVGTIAAVLRAVSAESHPHVHRAREELVSGGEARFAWALDVLVAGILGRPRPDAQAPRRAKGSS
jgi:AcrR family transcriptional regulator